MALGVPAATVAEGAPDRAEYVERVEPICKRNTEANERILAGARGKVKRGELPAAGRQFRRAARAFQEAIAEIISIPRPPADDRRLLRWIGHLRDVRDNMRKAGVALEEENRVRANHRVIRAERSGNAANNAGFAFDFHHCHLDASEFT